MTTVRYESELPTSASRLFEFHVDAQNLPVITPPFPPFSLLTLPKRTEAGDRQHFRIGWERFGSTWDAEVVRLVEGRLVEDVQVSGPFRSWRHRHEFVELGSSSVLLRDTVRFRLIPTPAGEFAEYFLVRPLVVALFRYRHRKTRRAFTHHNCS